MYCRNHRHYKLKFQLLLFNAYDINNIKPYFWSRMWDLHLSGLGPCSTGSGRYYLSGPFQGPKYKMQSDVQHKTCHTCIDSGPEVFWLRGHKSETVSLLVSVSRFLDIFYYRKWDWDQKWDCLTFMAPEPGLIRRAAHFSSSHVKVKWYRTSTQFLDKSHFLKVRFNDARDVRMHVSA